MSRHLDLDQALRAAAEPVPARVGQAPAQALVDRIVASDPSPVLAKAGSPARRRRLITVAAAALAVSAAALALPNLGADRAYASWTPDARPLPATQATAIVNRCVPDVGEPATAAEARTPRLILGEQRGAYAYLSITTKTWTATCFRDRDGAVHGASIFAAPVNDAQLGREGVELQAYGQLRTEEDYCRLIAGHLGSDVTGVTITVPKSPAVHATVKDGFFLAWYPEPDGPQSVGTQLALRLSDGKTVEGLLASDLYEAPRLK
ncbi:hypothetical protein [Nucisporomicrobium flavum]|uniref:hypothetical protein n=1 Tax=Nucisporomicrobium flavum TaxID=2785915 RepID=UPI0018F2C179|nr:hypothetical protein [Nucisporomicrobium flavum]